MNRGGDFENWEQYFAGKVALGHAIDYAQGWGLAVIRERIYGLAGELRRRLAQIDGVTVTDEGAEQCGIVTFTAAHCSATAIKQAMAAHQINVSTSSPGGTMVSYQQRGLTEVVRASLHYFILRSEWKPEFLPQTKTPVSIQSGV